jgi:hypothetical protein
MYSLENGILFHDGEPVIALGHSYYCSYHRQKIPVPENGDRLGEMQKDLRHIKESGFNIVRMAALGDVIWNNGGVQVNFPLPDAFCRECESLDIASMIRLQGYSMNLRGFKDATMIDQDGVPMAFSWGWFVRNCVNHPGILEDNIKGTMASSAHFRTFPSVVCFQIYNEPAYPTKGFYDYHPYSIEAYRAWLVSKGYASQKEAGNIDPPARRPLPGEDAGSWVNFRTFNTERLTNFLVQMADCAHEAYDGPETLTDQMPCPVMPGAAIRGEDYYEIARGMNIVGITHYIPFRGPSYHNACLALDAAESAAAVFGKHAWIIEYNARTNMPPREWDRETYAAMGRGFKGILYYQWRADYPFPDGPEPDEFGMLFNDGRKAPCYEAGIAMTRLINRLAPWLARADKERNRLALLYSQRAIAYFDALDNGEVPGIEGAHDRFVLALRRCYHALNARGIAVDFVRAEDLSNCRYSIDVLVLPMLQGLSEGETDLISAFEKSGGKVFCYQDEENGFLPFAKSQPVLHGIIREQYDAQSLLTFLAIEPHAVVSGAFFCDARLLTGMKDGKHFGIACLVNYDPLERDIVNAVLQIRGLSFSTARAYAPDLADDGIPLAVKDGYIQLPILTTGAYILME